MEHTSLKESVLTNITDDFTSFLLPETPRRKDLQTVSADYHIMLHSIMNFIAQRYVGNPDYPWIDTKIDLISGESYPVRDKLRGPETVYAWIQGRGLESIAEYLLWQEAVKEEDRFNVSVLKGILQTGLSVLKRARCRNRGHLFFFLNTRGDAINRTATGVWEGKSMEDDTIFNFSDLFCAKGMYAAACCLKDQDAEEETGLYCREVCRAIMEDRFVSDQQPLDPKNPVQAVHGRKTHAPYMLAVSLITGLVRRDGRPETVNLGLGLIDRILSTHVNLYDRWPDLKPYDFVEFIDDRGAPFRTEGAIISDPGHALEFIGLSLKFCRTARESCRLDDNQKKNLSALENIMFPIMKTNFLNGFSREKIGICKLLDLSTQVPVISDMPWWSLPETMRAALEVYEIAEEEGEKEFCLQTYSLCHNAFISRYVRKDRHLLAIQTLSAEGNIIDVIPATPDIDPGYHTGIALMDCIRISGRIVD